MIVREWRATASAAGADAYARHFTAEVVPALAGIPGHRGAYLLRRVDEPEPGVERITVLTLWESMAAIAAFAGADPEHAVVEPAAQAVLTDWDRTVRHHHPAPGSGDHAG